MTLRSPILPRQLIPCLITISLWCFMPWGAAQDHGRQSIEIGALGQTTDNKVTGPYHPVVGPSSFAIVGTHHRQVFAGPFADYTWAFSRSLSLEGRAAYLPGKQPIVDLSGGSALLVTGGIRATTDSPRVRLYARLAPGFISFSEAVVGISSTGWETSRLTHFVFDAGGGIEVRLSGANALRFDASRILYVEAGRSLGTFGAVNYTLGALVENHASFTAGLAHYFGQPFQASTGPEWARVPRNEATLSFALQTQPHLVFGGWQLSHDTGVAISGSHAFSRWIGVDGSAIVLPGGDAPNYQDGGTETALLAGLRVGVQHSRYGIFAKYRVGVASFASTINEKCGLTSACPRLGLRR